MMPWLGAMVDLVVEALRRGEVLAEGVVGLA